MPASNIELAQRTWPVLVDKAALRATITYDQLNTDIERGGIPVGLGPMLDLIADYCQAKGLPDLTILVVLKETGRPSKITVDDVDKERERVFARDWSKVPPPSADA